MKILFFGSNLLLLKHLAQKLLYIIVKAKMPFKKTKIKGGKMENIIDVPVISEVENASCSTCGVCGACGVCGPTAAIGVAGAALAAALAVTE